MVGASLAPLPSILKDFVAWLRPLLCLFLTHFSIRITAAFRLSNLFNHLLVDIEVQTDGRFLLIDCYEVISVGVFFIIIESGSQARFNWVYAKFFLCRLT